MILKNILAQYNFDFNHNIKAEQKPESVESKRADIKKRLKQRFQYGD